MSKTEDDTDFIILFVTKTNRWSSVLRIPVLVHHLINVFTDVRKEKDIDRRIYTETSKRVSLHLR